MFPGQKNRFCWSSDSFMHSSNPKEIVRNSKTQSRKFISRSLSRQFNAIFLFSGTWKNCRKNVYYFAEVITNNRNCEIKIKMRNNLRRTMRFRFHSNFIRVKILDCAKVADDDQQKS